MDDEPNVATEYQAHVVGGFGAGLFAVFVTNLTLAARTQLTDLSLVFVCLAIPPILVVWRVADQKYRVSRAGRHIADVAVVASVVLGYAAIALLVFNLSTIAGAVFVFSSLAALLAADWYKQHG